VVLSVLRTPAPSGVLRDGPIQRPPIRRRSFQEDPKGHGAHRQPRRGLREEEYERGKGSSLKGGIAQLVERRPCNWVVVFAGWMLGSLSGNDSIVYPNRWLTFFQKWKRGLEHAIQKSASCFLCLFTRRCDPQWPLRGTISRRKEES